MMPELAFIALGSNLGDRPENLTRAVAGLQRDPQTTVVALTEPEETLPLGDVPQGSYLNQMVLVETNRSPLELLELCQAVERAGGRERDVRWGPRTIDVDIVRYGDRHIDQEDLVIPHPEIPHRDFWQREIEELERSRDSAVSDG